jgi:hypothetical protein
MAHNTLLSESSEIVPNTKRQYRLATGDDVLKVARQLIK